MEVKIALWNSRGTRSKREEVTNKMSEYDILVISETKIKKSDILLFRGYDSVNYYRDINGIVAGGVSIIIRNGIKYEKIDIKGVDKEVMDCIGIKTMCDNKELIIIGIYRRPGTIMRGEKWRKLIRDNRGKNGGKVIITGDFNCHNRIWNCEETDSNGERLEAEMEEEEMYIINTETTSRLGEGHQRDSNLDLMFASRDMVGNIGYTRLDDSWGSDHIPIIFSLHASIQRYCKSSNRCSTKMTDWKEYRTIMKDREDEVEDVKYQELDLEEKYKYIKDMMIQSINVATGRKNTARFTSLDTSTGKEKEEQHSNNNRQVQDKE